MTYQEQALTGATGVDLIVSLYDGWIRFLYRARPRRGRARRP